MLEGHRTDTGHGRTDTEHDRSDTGHDRADTGHDLADTGHDQTASQFSIPGLRTGALVV